jgi:DNA-binding transcriptional MerR regulator
MNNMNLKTVVRMLNINENTLRAWERRYNAVQPRRDGAGRRTYSAEDIERLSLLTALVESGRPISQVAVLPTNKLRKLREDTPTLQILQKTSEVEAMNEPMDPHLNAILDALSKFDLDKLSQSLMKARFELSPRRMILELIVPLMREVGQRVTRSELTISQEHILSSLLRDHMGQIYQSMSPYDFHTRSSAHSIAIATREGDMHEFGIYMSSILCAVHRTKTHYFGCNMPADDLASACKELGVRTLILGLSSIPKGHELVDTTDFLKTLDSLLPESVEFWAGGCDVGKLQALTLKRRTLALATLQQLDDLLREDD